MDIIKKAELSQLKEIEMLQRGTKYISKEEFISILEFLGGMGSFTDLGDKEMQEEMWENYEEQRLEKKLNAK